MKKTPLLHATIMAAAASSSLMLFSGCMTQEARTDRVERRQDRIDERTSARQERQQIRSEREDARAAARFNSW